MPSFPKTPTSECFKPVTCCQLPCYCAQCPVVAPDTQDYCAGCTGEDPPPHLPPPQTVAHPALQTESQEQEAAVNTDQAPTLFPGAGPQIQSLLDLPLLNPGDLALRPRFAQTRSESELDIQGQADHAKDVRTLPWPLALPRIRRILYLTTHPPVQGDWQGLECANSLLPCPCSPLQPPSSLYTFIKEAGPECPCDWPYNWPRLGLTPVTNACPTEHLHS